MKKKLLTLTFTLILLIGLVAAMGMNAGAATCPIEGATGTGTEADPVIVDNTEELEKALEYNGTLHVVAKNFASSNITFSVSLPYAEISSKKVLYLKQDLEIRQINGAKGSLFSVKDGGDLTIIADDIQKVKFTNTVLELAGSTANATLKGALRFETTTDDGTLNSYALVAHKGSILIDGGVRFNTASLQNGAAIFKNGTIKGKVALKGNAFKLYPGSVGFFSDDDTAFDLIPNFGTTSVIREDLRVACIGGFNEQSPALESDAYTSSGTLTAAEEKVFLGMSRKYTFKTANNTPWAEEFVYTPTGTMEVIDSTGTVIYSKTDSDSGTFDENVSLSIDLKDVIKKAGKYQIKETIKLTKKGNLVSKYVHVYPIEVVEFNSFLGQSPVMPAGKTEHYLGEVTQSSYPITFYAHSLSSGMIAEGFTSNAKLMIYDENDRYIYGYKAYCNNGTDKVNYDLNQLSAGKYKIVETVELYNNDKEKVKSATNTFTIDWTPTGPIKTVNISAKWSGAPADATSSTKGIKVTDTIWEKWNATKSQWETATNITEGYQYRCMVELTPESGYELASGYTVKIGGFTAKRLTGTVWYVSRSITRVVSDVYVDELARPEVGAYPDFTGDPSSAYTAFDKAEWFPCTANGTKTGDALTADDKFDEGFYRLEVTVKPQKGQDVVFEEQWLNVSTYDFGLLDINGDDPVSWFYPDPEDHSVFTMWIVYHTDDAEGSYKLDLGGVTMKDGDYLAAGASSVSATKPNAGYAYYKDGVLTLNGYKNDSAELIFKERHLNINLIGENEIYSIHDEESGDGDKFCLTIGGEGSLEMWGGAASYVFAVNGDINFTGGKIRFDDGGYCGTYNTKNITIRGGAEVIFDAYSYGLTWGGIESLTVEDGSFYAFDGGSWENKWINQKISIPKGYVYVYDYSINPVVGTPKLSDAQKWDGVTDLNKYSDVWILSEEICLHSYDNACDAVCNDCGESRTPAAHTGGTATCTKKAQCTECAAFYGSLKAHSYAAATCTKAKTCKVCGVTSGSANGHKWTAATCTKAKTCSVCKATSGSKLGHTYTNNCDKSCNRCGATRTITHSYAAATCTKAKTCKVCGATSGKANGHKYTNACDTSCNTCKATRKITHAYKDVITKATLSKSGKIVNKCSVCGTVKSTKTIAYAKTFKLSATSYTYDGKVKAPTVTVKDSAGKTLKNGTDYTVKYASGRKSVGAYKVTITMKGNYTGTKTLTFNILPSKTSKITATQTTTTLKASWNKVTGATGYKVELLNSSGKVVKTATTKNLTYTFSKLTAGTNYKVRVTAYKTISGKNQYSLVSTTLSTATKPATPTLKVTSTKKGVANFTWTNVAGENGYQVYYSTSKSSGFKSAASYKTNVAKGSKSKLTSGKTYYFKVRSYKKVGNTTIYGDWSKVVSVKVK